MEDLLCSWWSLCAGEEQSGMSQEFLPGPLREGGSAPRERLGHLYT